MVKLADKCDEIHKAYKVCYLFSSSYRINVDVERCKEATKVFKLRSKYYLNVQLLIKSFLKKIQTLLIDALLISFDTNQYDPLEDPIKIVNETDINAKNIKFWIFDGQHTIQAAKEILANPKYSVSVEEMKKYKNVVLDS